MFIYKNKLKVARTLLVALFYMVAFMKVDNVSASNIQQFVRGTVTDNGGNPLPGVTVLVKGTQNATQTDFDGNYRIKASNGEVLVFSYVGMTSQEVSVSKAKMDVVLQENTSKLDEVVVTALGLTRKAKTLTYAQQNVKAADLAKTRDISIVGSLSGRAAGVDIKRSSSGQGGSTRIVLRGNKSASGDSSPLFVIDGIPMANNRGTQPGLWEGTDGGDGLSQLNPDDIESMTILRGANAAVLYGSQGANGVVVITTKKGRAGTTQISVNSGVTFENIIETPQLQFTYGAVSGAKESWSNNKGNTKYKQSDVDGFFQGGLTTINGVSISGGNDKTTAFFSYNNTYSKGVIPNNSYSKHNVSFRQSTKFFNNKVKVSSNLMLTQEISKNRNPAGYYLNPLTALYFFPRERDFQSFKNNFEKFDDIKNMMTQNWFVNDHHQSNPYWITNRQPKENKTNRIIANVALEYDIIEGLQLKVRGNLDYANKLFDHRLYAGSNATNAHANGRWTYRKWEDKLLYTDALLSYNKNFGDISFNAVAGMSYQRKDYGVGTSVDTGLRGIKYANIFNFQNINDNVPVTSTYGSRTAQRGIFVNTQLGYKDMIFLDISVRNDKSSTLAETGNDSYFYPAFGVTALVNEMIELPDFISFGKLRASYTTVAMPVPFNRVSPTNTINPTTGGINRNTTKPFTDLKPEKITSLEIGADWRFFNNRLGFDFTYYHINSKDQFIELPAPSGSGYTTYYVNAGSIVNKGIELSLNITPIRNNDFEWRTTFNYSKNENKVEELHKDLNDGISTGGSEGVNTRFKKGGSIGDFYGFKFDRDSEGRIKLDGNNKPKRTNKQELLGNANPDWQLGWNNTFTYKEFSLNLLFNGKFGGKVISQTESMLDGYGVSKRSADARDAGGFAGKFVKPDGTTVDKISAADYYKTIGGRNGIKEPYVYDRTNIRLSQLALSYLWKVNKPILKNITISLVGNNLFYVYKEAPFDPELAQSTGRNFQSLDNFNLPATRTYGLNVKFNF